MRRDYLYRVSVDVDHGGSGSSLHLGMKAAPAADETAFSTKRTVAGDPDTDLCPLGAQMYP